MSASDDVCKHYRTYIVENQALRIDVYPNDSGLIILMNSGCAVSQSDAAQLLKTTKLPYGADDALALARDLNIMRVAVSAEGLTHSWLQRLEIATTRTRNGIDNLIVDLPLLIDAQDIGGWNSVDGGEAKRILGSLLSACHETAAYLNRRLTGKFARAVTWHGDAIYLKWFLTSVADRARQTVNFSGARTIGIKFIQNALARANINQSEDAIFQALKRAASEASDGLESGFLPRPLSLSPGISRGRSRRGTLARRNGICK